jgi:hypothetical protein
MQRFSLLLVFLLVVAASSVLHATSFSSANCTVGSTTITTITSCDNTDESVQAEARVGTQRFLLDAGADADTAPRSTDAVIRERLATERCG